MHPNPSSSIISFPYPPLSSFNLFLPCIHLRPALRLLHKLLTVLAILLANVRLDRVISYGLDEQLAGELQNGTDFGARFPLIRPQHAEAHGALFIIGHVRVVYFGLEVEGRRFEGVVGWESQDEDEYTALLSVSGVFLVLDDGASKGTLREEEEKPKHLQRKGILSGRWFGLAICAYQIRRSKRCPCLRGGFVVDRNTPMQQELHL